MSNETIDFVTALGGPPRDDCASDGHDYAVVTAPVEVSGWPAAWKECWRCGKRSFLWLTASEAECWPDLVSAGSERDRAEADGQMSLFS